MARARSYGFAYNSTIAYTLFGDQLNLVQILVPVAGAAKTIKLFIDTVVGTLGIRGVIYADNAGVPGAKVLQGGNTTISAADNGTAKTVWSGTQALSAGKYWVGVHTETAFSAARGTPTLTDASWARGTLAFGSASPDPAGSGSASSNTLAAWITFEPTTETDYTNEGIVAGTSAGGETGAVDGIDVRKITVTNSGLISKVLADCTTLVWATNTVRPVIYDHDVGADEPTDLLASGPDIDIGPGQLDLPLTGTLEVLAGDILWVGIHTEAAVTSATPASTARSADNTSAFGSGAPDPFPSPSVANAQNTAFGFSILAGTPAPDSGGRSMWTVGI